MGELSSGVGDVGLLREAENRLENLLALNDEFLEN